VGVRAWYAHRFVTDYAVVGGRRPAG